MRFLIYFCITLIDVSSDTWSVFEINMNLVIRLASDEILADYKINASKASDGVLADIQINACITHSCVNLRICTAWDAIHTDYQINPCTAQMKICTDLDQHFRNLRWNSRGPQNLMSCLEDHPCWEVSESNLSFSTREPPCPDLKLKRRNPQNWVFPRFIKSPGGCLGWQIATRSFPHKLYISQDVFCKRSGIEDQFLMVIGWLSNVW